MFLFHVRLAVRRNLPLRRVYTQMQSNTFYISTAINYTNGSPHFGHAYEAISADVFARYHRLLGEDVFFTTGTDEHGQKVAESAANQKLTPIELCDKYVGEFQHLNERLHVSNDYYVRTTLDKHHETSQWLWKKAAAKGDIYHGAYEGWYNVREEKFVTETEAKSTEYKDPSSGKPLIKTKESSYFFRMSKYHEVLLKHIEEHPEFIQPESRKTEILERLKEPLIDLSVSRTTFDWGIPVPVVDGQEAPADEKHIMYVWFDALTNYLTSVDYAEGGALSRFWPCNVHLIGKDISWFHCVIWPCMLLSCEIPLPKAVLCHGFVNAEDGRKMSKSFGNVVEPNALLDKYPADSLRYFCMREGVFGCDFSFNEKSLVDRYDSELQGAMGNLVSRALTLCEKHSESKIPSQESYVLFDVTELNQQFQQEFSKFNVHVAIELVNARLSDVNKWLTEKAPWHMKEDQLDEKIKVVRTTLEAVYIIAHFFTPFVPTAMEKVFKYLNTPAKTLKDLDNSWSNLTPGTTIVHGDHIFPRIQENRHKRKQQPQAVVVKAPAQPAPLDVSRIDLRVGHIISCEPHPSDPDRLYVEKIACGDPEPRQVVSGLAQYVPIEQMRGARVVVVCNMKPSKFKGVLSTAMVLAANSDDHSQVVLVTPPADAPVGERLAVEGYNKTTDPHPLQLNPKKNEWETVKPDLRTDANGVACYKGVPLTTTTGPVTCTALPSSQLG